MSQRKQKRFRVTATVTFDRPMTMAEARRELRDNFQGYDFYLTSDGRGIIRGPFQASAFPRKIRK